MHPAIAGARDPLRPPFPTGTKRRHTDSNCSDYRRCGGGFGRLMRTSRSRCCWHRYLISSHSMSWIRPWRATASAPHANVPPTGRAPSLPTLTSSCRELGGIVPVWRRLALRSWQADEARCVASVVSCTPGPHANSITRASARLKAALGFIALLVINDVREFCCKWQTD
jgi:hypothetical protein